MYSFTSNIRFSEVDTKRNLSLGSIINYFQDCSTFHSESVGKGFDYLAEHNRVWLMSAWQVVIYKRPKFGEAIRIGTWAYDFKSMYGYRNFVIQNPVSNETLVAANSIWVYADTKTGKPVKVLPENCEGYINEPPYPMEYCDRKIMLPTESEALPAFSVTQSHLDCNHHVNNGQYIRMAESYLPEDFTVLEFRADYRKAAVADNIIHPLRSLTADTCTIVLADEMGKPYTTVQFLREKEAGN